MNEERRSRQSQRPRTKQLPNQIIRRMLLHGCRLRVAPSLNFAPGRVQDEVGVSFGAGSLLHPLAVRYGRALQRRCGPALRLQPGRAMVTFVVAIAEFERNVIIEQVGAGMRRTRLEG